MFWTPLKLALLSKRVRAYNRAITMEAKSLSASGFGNLARYLPSKVTVEEIRNRVLTAAEGLRIEAGDKQERAIANNRFRRIVGYETDKRSSELTRILKRNNPTALELTVDSNGNPTTEYALKESRYRKAARTRERNRQRKLVDQENQEMGLPSFDDMSAPEYAGAMNGNGLYAEDEGEPDDTYTDVSQDTVDGWVEEDLGDEFYRNQVGQYFRTYMSEWENPLNRHELFAGYESAVSAMEWLYDNAPDVLFAMFSSGVNEMDIAWIVDSGAQEHNPYVNIPFETRHNSAVSYITMKARKAGWNG